MTVTVTDSGAQLDPDLSRVALRLFLPGEDTHEESSRVAEIGSRILAIEEDVAQIAAPRIVTSFTGGVDHLTEALKAHADSVAFSTESGDHLSPARKILLGAAFTAEYAVEGAALCNPSAMPHPDQTGLEPGQLRVAVALRGIGEGHISSIEFMTAVVGPGARWEFGRRDLPVVVGTTSPPLWVKEHFVVAIESEMRGHGVELAHAVARLLPDEFTMQDFEGAVRRLPAVLLQRAQATQHLERLHAIIESAYHSTFPADTDLSQRVLMPASRDEVNGMEDARFVLCDHPDGTQDYRATYTAYDGHNIAPRLLVTKDLVTFDIHRLSGPAARNKGMALFPRHVGGTLLALTRSDGETLGVARSEHGRVWSKPKAIHRPTQLWEIIQTGNCGSPLETEHGWLVLTHGVGPVREYCIGAILLDLDDPTRVIAALEEPLITPYDRAGYVPNVVYSCGGIIHDGTLWIPHGVGDNRIRVASVPVDDLIAAMTPNKS